MVRYIPTHNGHGIVSLHGCGDDMTCSNLVMPIQMAENELRNLRRDADLGGMECGSIRGNPGLSALYLEWANSLSDALTFASELRAEAEANSARAAA